MAPTPAPSPALTAIGLRATPKTTARVMQNASQDVAASAILSGLTKSKHTQYESPPICPLFGSLDAMPSLSLGSSAIPEVDALPEPLPLNLNDGKFSSSKSHLKNHTSKSHYNMLVIDMLGQGGRNKVKEEGISNAAPKQHGNGPLAPAPLYQKSPRLNPTVPSKSNSHLQSPLMAALGSLKKLESKQQAGQSLRREPSPTNEEMTGTTKLPQRSPRDRGSMLQVDRNIYAHLPTAGGVGHKGGDLTMAAPAAKRIPRKVHPSPALGPMSSDPKSREGYFGDGGTKSLLENSVQELLRHKERKERKRAKRQRKKDKKRGKDTSSNKRKMNTGADGLMEEQHSSSKKSRTSVPDGMSQQQAQQAGQVRVNSESPAPNQLNGYSFNNQNFSHPMMQSVMPLNMNMGMLSMPAGSPTGMIFPLGTPPVGSPLVGSPTPFLSQNPYQQVSMVQNPMNPQTGISINSMSAGMNGGVFAGGMASPPAGLSPRHMASGLSILRNSNVAGK